MQDDITPPPAEDDAAIARHLAGANMPALLMSIIHMTGDTSLLDGPVRPKRLMTHDVRGRMAEDDEAFLIARGVRAIAEWRARGWTLPDLAPATITRMMDVCTGAPIPQEYTELLTTELITPPPPVPHTPPARPWRIVIIGAGMSGIAAAIKLREAGHHVLIIERNPSVGGTWYENRYPGCRVDVPNHFYAYSFRKNDGWKRYFSPQEDLLSYFRATAEDHGLAPYLRLNTEVEEARWDETARQWQVSLRDISADGQTPPARETLAADAVISAVGLFNQPAIPDFPGRELFTGPAFHSARWPEGMDLTGKRVVVIGSGASAFQIVPEIAKVAQHVTVFQRTPGWLVPAPDYHAQVDDETLWCLRHLPFYARWFRFMLFWASADSLLPALRADPAWPDLDRSLNVFSDKLRIRMTEYLRQQTAGDDALFEKLLPDYPPYGKRPLIDNGSWIAALRRETVDLINAPVRELTAEGVIDSNGQAHAADVIVFATGFHAGRYLHPMTIIGEAGRDLRAEWGDTPRAYLGIMAPGFPNFFCLYGPGTNFGHGGSIIFMVECQISFILATLAAAEAQNATRIAVQPAATAAYISRLERELAQLIWSRPNVRTYYKNDAGVVTTTMPWRILDYWRWTRQIDPAALEFAA